MWPAPVPFCIFAAGAPLQNSHRSRCFLVHVPPPSHLALAAGCTRAGLSRRGTEHLPGRTRQRPTPRAPCGDLHARVGHPIARACAVRRAQQANHAGGQPSRATPALLACPGALRLHHPRGHHRPHRGALAARQRGLRQLLISRTFWLEDFECPGVIGRATLVSQCRAKRARSAGGRESQSLFAKKGRVSALS